MEGQKKEPIDERKQKIEWYIRIILEDGEGHLSEWETHFIESVEKQFIQRGTLTDKQLEVLERIYEKL